MAGGYSSTTSTRWRTFLSIPASCGLSACSEVRPILPRPRARRVPRWRALWPIELRVCLIFTFDTLCLLRRRSRLRRWLLVHLCSHRQHLANCQAPRGSNVLRGAEVLQALDGRLQHVRGIRRPEALGEDVADAAQLEDGADAAAGDDAGSLARGVHLDARRAELADDLVRDRRPMLRDREEVLLRIVDRLRDRERHLARLAVAEADAVDLVADHDERGEREPPAALDDFGNTVDLDHALLELAALFPSNDFALDWRCTQNFRTPSRAASASAFK